LNRELYEVESMSLLLEDLAEAASENNTRVAERIDEECRLIAELRNETTLEDFKESIRRTLQQITGFTLSQVPQHEGFMEQAVAILRTEPSPKEGKSLLQVLLKAFTTCKHLICATISCWTAAQPLKLEPERLDELERAKSRLQGLIQEVELSIKIRTGDWQPKDPKQLTEGLRLAREGKTISMSEARSRARRTAS
jgi:hypothetical protein